MFDKLGGWAASLRTQLARELSHANRGLVVAKIVGILAFLYVTNTVTGKRGVVAYSVLALVWLVSFVGLVHVAFFARAPARIVWTAMVVFGAFVGSSFRAIFDLALTLFDVDRMLGNLGDANTVLPFYAPKLVTPAIFCAIGLVSLTMPPFAKSVSVATSWRRRARQIAFQSTPVFLMAMVLLLKRGEATNGFPVQHASWSFLTVLGIERVISGAKPARQEVAMTPSGPRPFRNIVVVMDESARGAALDLNSVDGAESSLKGRPDVVNFGIMCSIANCSYESNISFRYGVGREDYLGQLFANPSMWAYAKRAGYDTYYLDAQRFDGALQSGMDVAELKKVDHHIQLAADVKPEARDLELAQLLRRVLKEQAGRPSYIFMQKMGSHYPYEGKYPASERLLNPVMERTYFGNEADPRRVNRDGEDKVPDAPTRMKNSYYNSLRWNTKRFFEIVLDGLDLSETVIVFMGDHGQDLHQDGRPGHNTHCTTGDAHPDEGRIPFVLITQNQDKLADFRAAAAANFDKTSQFSVFPSVIEWMGYPREQITANTHFDPPLDAPPAKDNQRYISKYFVRLGAKPVWSTCVLPQSTRVSEVTPPR